MSWYRWLGMDSNGNLVTSNGNFWFNPGKQMMAICSLTTDPIGGLETYYEGLRLNRSCVASGDSWTTLLLVTVGELIVETVMVFGLVDIIVQQITRNF